MTTDRVIYVGPFSYPNGGAAAKRIHYISKAIVDAGKKVTIASGQTENINTTMDGIDITSLNERTSEHLPRLLKHLSYVSMGSKTIKWLNNLEEKPCAIILYSGYTPYLSRLIKWGNKYNVKIIFDAVEWYDPPSKLHSFHPYYLNIEFAMRFLLPKCDGIIAISKYLTSYYKEKKCKVITVPPTCELCDTSHTYSYNSNQIEIVYAGSPGHKDKLADIIAAANYVRSNGLVIKINVVGLDEKQLIEYCNHNKVEISDKKLVKAHGYLPLKDVEKIVALSDFSILIRPNARFANAGFSTKFVESLMNGTPVIANLTSDLGDYLFDGTNGVVCTGYDRESIAHSIQRAAEFKSDKKKYLQLRDAAKRTAEGFNYKAFEKVILSLL